MKPIRFVAIVVVAAGFALAGCGQNAGGGTAAQVGASVITVDTVQRELNAFKANPGFADQIVTDGTIDPEFVASWMSSDIESLLIDEFLVSRGITVSEKEILRARLGLRSRLGQDPTGNPTFDAFPRWFQDALATRQANGDAAVRSFVNQDAATYFQANEASVTQACASKKVVRHILVKTQVEADQALAQLAAGANFADLASSLSIDSGSGANGGLLGCYEAGSYVDAFENVVSALPVGGRAVATTQFGVHVIEVLGLSAVSLAVEIDRALRQEGSKQLQAYLVEQVTNRPTRVNPRFGVLEITANAFVAPIGSAQRVRTEPSPATTVP